MPDPTTPKKKKPAAPPARSADAPAPLPYDEANRQYTEALQGDQEQTPTDTPTEPAPNPVQGFWDRVLHGVNGEGSRVVEAAKGAARGVVNAGREAANTLNEAATASGAMTTVQTEGVGAPSTDAQVAHYLGKRSDDPLASFTESVSQFATGWAATGELKALKGVGLAKMLLRGATVDATMFNPREAQLAELAAKAPVPIVKQVGELLSVNGDDNQAVARLKRAAAGMVPVTAIETLVNASRVIRGARIAASATATPAEKATADEAAQQAAESLQNITESTHTIDGQTLTVRPAREGGYTIESLKDEKYVPIGKPAPPLQYEATMDGIKVKDPVFTSRAEAEQQAETMNNALNERANVGKVDEAAATRIEDSAASIGKDNGKAFTDAVEQPDLNVSIHNSVEDNMKLISDLSERLATGVRRSVEANGKVSVEDAFGMARKALGNMTEAQAPEVLTKRLGDFEGQSSWNVAANMTLKDMGKKIGRMSDVIEARPHDPVAVSEARDAVMNYFKLRDAIYGSESDAARTLRFVQEKSNPLSEDVKFSEGGKPAAEAAAPEAGTPAADEATADTPAQVAGMNARDASQKVLDEANVRVTARMFKLANGEPRNMEAVINGSKVFQNTGMMSKAIEVFTNFLLSGPKTWLTVPLSGVTTTTLEPIARMAAGVATANRGLFREGADIMWGNYKYLVDNAGIAAAAMREGRSIINPAPSHVAIGGLTGQLIRTPSRILTALDEFTRVANYRAYVRAKSLRLAREQGLEGTALEARVDGDLRAAFDPETGIATLPDALKYAEVPTFSGPLGADTFGGKFHEFTNNAVEAKFIAPFIKASVNIFRYVWQSTPLLNIANRQARSIMEAGGEEAAVLHARSALAGTVYGVGIYNALAGNLTGRGPTDPDLRKLWLRNHQPYSLRVGSEWVSYRRADPLATPLGLIADGATFINELGDKDKSAEDYAYAVVASLVSNLGSKTYMQGITEFAQAWGAGDASKAKSWIQNFAGNLSVPQLVSSANPDPYYREVRTMGDAIMSRVPGFSETLDPRYDIFGEPVMKAPGYINRGANVLTFKPVGHSVEDDLQALDKGLSSMPEKQFNGFIDLSDRSTYDNGTKVSPYARIMQLVRKPENGSPPLKDAMTDLVKSDKWKNASDGVTLIPGGARWIYAASLKEKYEQKALQQTLREYPKLKQQWEGIQRLRGAAITGGEQGVADTEAMFGVHLNKQ